MRYKVSSKHLSITHHEDRLSSIHQHVDSDPTNLFGLSILRSRRRFEGHEQVWHEGELDMSFCDTSRHIRLGYRF
jgi:predicted transcriptional regulator with HTH domain